MLQYAVRVPFISVIAFNYLAAKHWQDNPGIWREDGANLPEFIEWRRLGRFQRAAWPLSLTAWTKVRTPARNDHPLNRRSAGEARFTRSQVDPVF
jgi:hypothetical protein